MKQFSLLRHLAVLAAAAQGKNIALEYGIVSGSGVLSAVQWKPVAEVPLDLESIEPGFHPLEFSDGKVQGSVPGDGQALADDIWDQYKPGDWVGFRLGQSTKISFLDLTSFRSSFQLSKALSNLAIGVVLDQTGTIKSAAITIPWQDLTTLESSSRRVGSIAVHKPVFPTAPLVPPAIPDIIEPQPVDPAARPQASQGFMGKYWWAILLGFLVMQMFNGQPNARQGQATGGQTQQSARA